MELKREKKNEKTNVNKTAVTFVTLCYNFLTTIRRQIQFYAASRARAGQNHTVLFFVHVFISCLRGKKIISEYPTQ